MIAVGSFLWTCRKVGFLLPIDHKPTPKAISLFAPGKLQKATLDQTSGSGKLPHRDLRSSMWWTDLRPCLAINHWRSSKKEQLDVRLQPSCRVIPASQSRR